MEEGLHLPLTARDSCHSSAFGCDQLPTWKRWGKKDAQSQHLTLSLSVQALSTQSSFAHTSRRAGACRAAERWRRAEEHSLQGWQPAVTCFCWCSHHRQRGTEGAALQQSRRKALAQPSKSSSAGESRHHKGLEIDAWAVQPPLPIPKCCQIQGLNSCFAIRLRASQTTVSCGP